MLSLLTVVLVVTSYAEEEKIPEIKTSSGKTYHDVRVTKVTPCEISIMHESGVTRIPLKDLPDDLKTKFGYDPVKAAEFQKQASAKAAQNEADLVKYEAAANQAAQNEAAAVNYEANQAADYQKKVKSAEQSSFRIFQIIKNDKGVIANFYSPGGAAGAGAQAVSSIFGRSNSVVASSVGELVFLHGEILPNLVDGAVVEAFFVDDGIYQYTTTSGSTSTVKKLEVLKMRGRR